MMGLQHNFDYKGLTATTAYSRIYLINNLLVKGETRFTVAVYASKTARDNGVEPLDYVTFPTTMPDENTMKEAGKSLLTELYAWLKTKPAYAGAIDSQ